MSALELRPFKMPIKDLKYFRDDEKKSVPTEGIPVFIFISQHLLPEDYIDPIDKINFQRVYKAFNFRRMDKFDRKTVSSTKSMSNKENGDGFIDNRVKEKSVMYDELVHLFLTYLHKSYWNKSSNKEWVESTIVFQDAYDSVYTGIEAFRIVLEQIIDDKYPEKYSEAEVNNARKENALNISEKVGKIKK